MVTVKMQFPDSLTPNMVKGIKGFNLCAFLMGIEGWRRGLTLKYYADINQHSNIHTQGKKRIGKNYSLESNDKIHYFNQSRGDIVSNRAVKIANNKSLTKDYLQKSGISLMPSIEFNKHTTDEKIVGEAKKIGFPIVIKPVHGSLSRGVIINLKNESELKNALVHVRQELGYKSVIVERYFDGDDIRAYVVNHKVVAAIKRKPAMVTGDGISSLKQLIEQKNQSRKENPYLAARPIKIDDEVHNALKKENYKLESVLEKGKTVLVKNKNTLTQGVDLYDITDEIPEQIKQLAIDTLNSIPDIQHGSIDMLYNGVEAIVLEVNASANISMHMFPTEGQPRNISAHIIDFYFPDTVGKSAIHSNMYFDYLTIIRLLKKNYINHIELEKIPEGPVYARKYIVSGKVQKVGYRKWLRRKAILNNVHGYAKNLYSHDVKVVIGSNDIEKINRFEMLCKKGPKKAKINSMKSQNWNKEIKMGFEIM